MRCQGLEQGALAAGGFIVAPLTRWGFAHAKHVERLMKVEVVFWKNALACGLQKGGAVEPGVFDVGVNGVGVECSVWNGPEETGNVSKGGDRVQPGALVFGMEDHGRTVMANGV